MPWALAFEGLVISCLRGLGGPASLQEVYHCGQGIDSKCFVAFFFALYLLAFEGVSSQLAAPAAIPAACCDAFLPCWTPPHWNRKPKLTVSSIIMCENHTQIENSVILHVINVTKMF